MRFVKNAVEMVVTGHWDSEAFAAFEKHHVNRLVLNYALGFDEPSLEFLRGLPLRELVILDRRLKSLEPIYSLRSQLEVLHVTTDPTLVVDLHRLPALRELAVDWIQVSETISAGTRLSTASLRNYTPTDLTPLNALSNLAELRMKDRPRLRVLKGVARLLALRRLAIFLAKDLTDISELRDQLQLQELELEACKKISEIDDVKGCVDLRRLNFSECGSLASLSPLRNLVNIEHLRLFGSTKIADNDLAPIAGLTKLKTLRMQSRKSYRPMSRRFWRHCPAPESNNARGLRYLMLLSSGYSCFPPPSSRAMRDGRRAGRTWPRRHPQPPSCVRRSRRSTPDSPPRQRITVPAQRIR